MQKYEEEIKDKTIAFQEEILKLHEIKSVAIKYCKKVLYDAEKQAEANAIQFTDAFKDKYTTLRKLMED